MKTGQASAAVRVLVSMIAGGSIALLAGCSTLGGTEARGPRTTSSAAALATRLEAEVGTMDVTMQAGAGSSPGEVCVEVGVSIQNRPIALDRECDSTALPVPPLGGYAMTDLDAAGKAYAWGMLGESVADVRVPAGAIVDVADLHASNGCCRVFLLAVDAKTVPKDAIVALVDAQGLTLDQIALGDRRSN